MDNREAVYEAFRRREAYEAARQRSLEDPNVPPEYKGRVWEYPTSKGIVYTCYPPLRTDPFSVTEEFMDFRAHHVKRMAEEQEGRGKT